MPESPFKRLILRAVLRDVYPMVIRLVAVPDSLDLADFDAIFHTLLGWDSGTGYAFQVHGQEFNSFRRQTRTKKLRDFQFHRQEKLLYTLGAMDQWEWEVRVVDLQNGVNGDQTPLCVCVWVGGEQRHRSIAAARPAIG
jgi:Plasmid pRiA4b ORF-3-like protein